jgi:biotin carboxyl carrier protein
MKLKAQLTGKEHEVSLRFANGSVDAELNGQHYNLEIRELGRGEYLLVSGAKVYKCRVAHHGDSFSTGQSFEVVLRGRNYEIALVDPKRLRSAQSTGGHHTGAAEIVSPMPGKIVKILVNPGSQVEAGAGVIIVEAMKMQNEMKAPRAGTLVSIAAEEGATVNAGDVLAVIE